jgi:hypothetical protein
LQKLILQMNHDQNLFQKRPFCSALNRMALNFDTSAPRQLALNAVPPWMGG